MDENKLEFKDIAGYLPYHLFVKVKDNYPLEVTIDKTYNSYKFTHVEHVIADQYKPILRTMEDITKEITECGYNNDEPFTPLIRIAEACYPEFSGWRIDDEGRAYTRDNGYPHWITTEDVELATFEIFDMLSQWHFDYRGLIAKGLAVDINTIKR